MNKCEHEIQTILEATVDNKLEIRTVSICEDCHDHVRGRNGEHIAFIPFSKLWSMEFKAKDIEGDIMDAVVKFIDDIKLTKVA